MLTLNPGVAIAARDAIHDSNSSAKLATFDLSGDVVSAIKAGQILFAVDQEQYLQGYLPIVFLYLYKTNLNTVGGGLPVLTGPGYVTQDNADKAAKLAEQGTCPITQTARGCPSMCILPSYRSRGARGLRRPATERGPRETFDRATASEDFVGCRSGVLSWGGRAPLLDPPES